MTTAIDTNVIITLWDEDPARSELANRLLRAASAHGDLVISPVVFGELMAAPGRTEEFLDAFVDDTSIRVDWSFDESIWRTAGRAFQAYAMRRRKNREPGPRRILADFLIGAHALQNKYRLLTLDDRIYRAAFPKLIVVGV